MQTLGKKFSMTSLIESINSYMPKSGAQRISGINRPLVLSVHLKAMYKICPILIMSTDGGRK